MNVKYQTILPGFMDVALIKQCSCEIHSEVHTFH